MWTLYVLTTQNLLSRHLLRSHASQPLNSHGSITEEPLNAHYWRATLTYSETYEERKDRCDGNKLVSKQNRKVRCQTIGYIVSHALPQSFPVIATAQDNIW